MNKTSVAFCELWRTYRIVCDGGVMFAEYESSLCDEMNIGAVYEFDGRVSFFYLLHWAEDDRRMLGAIRVKSGESGQALEGEVDIRWDENDEHVALFLRGELFAVFDTKTYKGYANGPETPEHSRIPEEIASRFLG